MTDIQNMADAIRFLALDSILNAGEGHQGVPLGMAEIAATLYTRHIKLDPKNPLWPGRDRVVLSNGHGSMLLYALLHLSGYEKVTIAALRSFCTLHGVCAGHPEIEQDAGIEITTGLLGQGIASAVGMAVAEARLADRFGPGLVDHRTWALVGVRRTSAATGPAQWRGARRHARTGTQGGRPIRTAPSSTAGRRARFPAAERRRGAN